MPYPSIVLSVRLALAVLLFGGVSAPARGAGMGSKKTVVYSRGSPDAYVFARSQRFFSTNISIDEIESLRHRLTDAFLWVRRGGKEFVIRDPRAIDEAQRLFDPLKRLDPEREALSGRQERIASEESVLEAEEEKLDRELEQLDGENGEDGLRESTRAGSSADASRESGAVRAELERRRGSLEVKLSALEARQREVDALERSLDRRSDALEAEAEAALWAFIERTATRGIARSLTPPSD